MPAYTLFTFSLVIGVQHDAHVLQQHDEGNAPEDEGDGAKHVVGFGLEICAWPHGTMDSRIQACMPSLT